MSQGPQDLVRVLRVVEYVGPRAAVEECVANSIHGVRHIHGGHMKGLEIRAATIGIYPEVLTNLSPDDTIEPRQ